MVWCCLSCAVLFGLRCGVSLLCVLCVVYRLALSVVGRCALWVVDVGAVCCWLSLCVVIV